MENTTQDLSPPSIQQRYYIPPYPPLKLVETLKNIWKTPNLRLIASTNCLEWIDMFIFVHGAALFASVFAPQRLQENMGLTFAVMLWTIRPFGAIGLGFLADKFGRKIPMLTTAAIITFLTIALIITPSFAQAGMWAFAIFMTIRVIMTFVMAGESMLAHVYGFETTKRYIDTVIIIPLIDMGEIFAGLFVIILTTSLLNLGGIFSEEYIVRCLLASLSVLFIILLKNRKKLTESREFLKERDLHEDKSIYRGYFSLKFIVKEKGALKEWILYSGTQVFYSLAFVIVYVYMGQMLKERVHYSNFDVMQHNFSVLMGEGIIHIIVPLVAFKLEAEQIFSRRQTVLTVFTAALIGIVTTYFYLNNSTHINPIILIPLQVSLLVTFNSVMAGHFFLNFPVLGRARIATMGWAIAQILVFCSGTLLMENLKSYGSYDYLFVLLGAWILHFSCIYFSKEPDRLGRYAFLGGRSLLYEKILAETRRGRDLDHY